MGGGRALFSFAWLFPKSGVSNHLGDWASRGTEIIPSGERAKCLRWVGRGGNYPISCPWKPNCAGIIQERRLCQSTESLGFKGGSMAILDFAGAT